MPMLGDMRAEAAKTARNIEGELKVISARLQDMVDLLQLIVDHDAKEQK